MKRTLKALLYEEDGDYYLKPEGQTQSRRWVLCGEGGNEWWDLNGAPEVHVIVSTRNFESAYLCNIDPLEYRFWIKDPETDEWLTYGIYNLLKEAIMELNSPSKFYLGVHVPT
jgi:hypothetical protein